jgi:hypothetical protein
MADPLLQASQFGRQSSELEPQLIVLVPESLNGALQSEDQLSGTGRARQPDRFWNPAGGVLITGGL